MFIRICQLAGVDLFGGNRSRWCRCEEFGDADNMVELACRMVRYCWRGRVARWHGGVVSEYLSGGIRVLLLPTGELFRGSQRRAVCCMKGRYSIWGRGG